MALENSSLEIIQCIKRTICGFWERGTVSLKEEIMVGLIEVRGGNLNEYSTKSYLEIRKQYMDWIEKIKDSSNGYFYKSSGMNVELCWISEDGGKDQFECFANYYLSTVDEVKSDLLKLCETDEDFVIRTYMSAGTCKYEIENGQIYELYGRPISTVYGLSNNDTETSINGLIVVDSSVSNMLECGECDSNMNKKIVYRRSLQKHGGLVR